MGQKGTLAYIWARCGTRPGAVQDTRYAWAYLFGAVCPERAVGAGLVLPYANTEAMNRHLIEIGKAVAPGTHAALVLDGAGWHSSDELIVPDNISLVKLPPYAPELNPIENVWALPPRHEAGLPSVQKLEGHRQRLLRCLEYLRRRRKDCPLHHGPPMGNVSETVTVGINHLLEVTGTVRRPTYGPELHCESAEAQVLPSAKI